MSKSHDDIRKSYIRLLEDALILLKTTKVSKRLKGNEFSYQEKYINLNKSLSDVTNKVIVFGMMLNA